MYASRGEYTYGGASRPAWRDEMSPEALFCDGELAAAARGVTGAMSALLPDGGTLLAIPISDSEPFPMTPIFCLGEPRFIDGGEYLVFAIRDGKINSSAAARP
jgi:hypothetical protein